jgi:hypothetical protein
VARRVKRADLLDNLDQTRRSSEAAKAEDRMRRYRDALAIIEEVEAVA